MATSGTATVSLPTDEQEAMDKLEQIAISLA